MRKILALVAVCLSFAGPAAAQASLDAQAIYLGTYGGTICKWSSGSGAPSGTNTCDHYTDTSTGDVYDRKSGVWLKVGSVAYGGTGVGTFTTNGVLYGNGTTSVLVTSQGATNSVLTASAGAPSFSATPTVTSLTATSSLTTPTVGASSNLTLSPTGDLVLAPAGVDVLPNTGYTVNLGALTNKYLTLHAAELWVETLVAQNTVATIGGRVLVGPTNILAANAGTGATTLTFKYNNFSNGDRIYFEANGSVEFMAVTSSAGGSAGAYTYSVTRNLDGSGANAWTAGDAAFDTGTTGNGFIDLYSVAGVLPGSTAGPTIVGNVRTGTTYNNIAPRWAIGNLNGLYGYSGSTYGAAFGDPSGAWLKIDPTNGVRIGYNSTTKTQLDASGNASFVSGALTITENGVLLTPGTTASVWSVGHGYNFVDAGSLGFGMAGYDDGTARGILTQVNSTFTGSHSAVIDNYTSLGAGTITRLLIDSEMTTSTVTLSSFSTGSGTTSTINIAAATTGGTSVINLNAQSITVTGTLDSTLLLGSAKQYSWAGDTDTYIDNDAANRIRFGAGAVNIFWDGSQLFPENDGTKNLGVGSFRWNTVYATNGTINTSDARQKTAIRDTAYGPDFLLALRPVDYQWKNPAFGTGVYQGFLAQDVAAVAPNFGGIHYGPDGVADGLTYTAFIAPLVAGYQDLAARVRALEKKEDK